MIGQDRPVTSGNMLSGAVCLGAMAWPWGAYQQIYFGVSLFYAALAMCSVVFFLSLLRDGRPPIPFDMLWPVLLILSSAAVLCALGESSLATGIILGCCSFLLALFGATNQTLVFRALAASCLSAACVAVLTLFAEYNSIFPTFFSATGGAVGAGPTNLAEALVLFAWSFCLALALFLARHRIRWGVVAWSLPIAAFLCAAALAALTTRLHDQFSVWKPNFGILAFPGLPMVLIGLYMASRAAARIFMLPSPSLFSPRNLLAVLLLSAALALALFGQIPSPGLCFSFGLAAALGIQRTLRNTQPVTVGWSALLLAPVLVAHAFMLFPGDARHYLLHAQRRNQEAGCQAAQDFLRLVLERFPGESRARLELARYELERGQVDAAVDTFLGALRETRPSRVLDRPKQGVVDEFLVSLKSKTNSLPGICLERCLVGTDRVEEAVALLKSRINGGSGLNIDSEPLRRALASLMGGQENGLNLSAWNAAELVAGLRLCGPYCQAIQAPADIPRRFLPAVLVARPVHDGRMVTVFFPGGQLGRSWRMPLCTGGTPGEGESWWLDPAFEIDQGEWYVSLAGAAEVVLGNEVRLSLIEDARFDCGPGSGGWAVTCLLP